MLQYSPSRYCSNKGRQGASRYLAELPPVDEVVLVKVYSLTFV